MKNEQAPEPYGSFSDLRLLRLVAWESDQTKQMLRNAGFGVTGTGLLETAKEAVEARANALLDVAAELEILTATNATVRAYLRANRQGMPLTKAIVGMIASLAQQNERLLQESVGKKLRDPDLGITLDELRKIVQ